MLSIHLHTFIRPHFQFLTLGFDVHFTRWLNNVEFDIMIFSDKCPRRVSLEAGSMGNGKVKW